MRSAVLVLAGVVLLVIAFSRIFSEKESSYSDSKKRIEIESRRSESFGAKSKDVRRELPHSLLSSEEREIRRDYFEVWKVVNEFRNEERDFPSQLEYQNLLSKLEKLEKRRWKPLLVQKLSLDFKLLHENELAKGKGSATVF